MAILDELLVALGYEFDDSELDDFRESTEDVIKTVKGLAVAIGAATAAAAAFFITSANGTDELAKSARQLNIQIGELDALRFAADKSVGSSEALNTSLFELSKRASEAARGNGEAAQAFARLGISVLDANGKLKTTDRLLLESADALNNLADEGQRLELADKLGIKDVNLLLQLGSKGIRELTSEAKALGVATEADAKAAEDFNDSLREIQQITVSSARAIATDLLPEITKIIRELKKWFIANRKLIKQRMKAFLQTIITVLKAIVKFIGAVIDVVGKFVDAIGGLDVAMNLLIATFATFMAMKVGMFLLSLVGIVKALGAAGLVANLKLAAIPLTILAAILLIDDLIAFLQGRGSVIGDVIGNLGEGNFPALERFINTIKKIFEPVFGRLKDAFESLKTFINDVFSAESFSDLVNAWLKLVSSNVDSTIERVNELIEVFKELFDFDFGLKDKLDDFTEAVKEKFGPFKEGETILDKLTGGIGSTESRLIEGLPGSTETTNNNLSSLSPVININVSNENQQELAIAIREEFESYFEQINSTFQTSATS